MSPQYKAPGKRWQGAGSWEDISELLADVEDEDLRRRYRVRERAGEEDLPAHEHPETARAFAAPEPAEAPPGPEAFDTAVSDPDASPSPPPPETSSPDDVHGVPAKGAASAAGESNDDRRKRASWWATSAPDEDLRGGARGQPVGVTHTAERRPARPGHRTGAAWGALAGMVATALYLATVQAGTDWTGILCMFLVGFLVGPAFLLFSVHGSWGHVLASMLLPEFDLGYWTLRIGGGLLSIAWLWLARVSFDQFAAWSPLPAAPVLAAVLVVLGSGFGLFFHWLGGGEHYRHLSIPAVLSGMPLAVVVSCGILAVGFGAEAGTAAGLGR